LPFYRSISIFKLKRGIFKRKEEWIMNRQKIYKEIEQMFGLVPSFIKMIPDSSLELEWKLMKQVQFDEGPIPNKYRELIGIAVAAVMKCRYCSLFHTEGARMNGATDAEIEDAVHFAKSSAGWSTYLNGLQVDYDQFREEIKMVSEHARSHQFAEKELRCRDVGADCDYVVRGKTEEEIFRKASEHAKKSHGMKEISPELMEKARSAIRSVA
jgi:AhpD family alkylhydroperoxidase